MPGVSLRIASTAKGVDVADRYARANLVKRLGDRRAIPAAPPVTSTLMPGDGLRRSNVFMSVPSFASLAAAHRFCAARAATRRLSWLLDGSPRRGQFVRIRRCGIPGFRHAGPSKPMKLSTTRSALAGIDLADGRQPEPTFEGRRAVAEWPLFARRRRPESTYCGRSRPRPSTPQLGGDRTLDARRSRSSRGWPQPLCMQGPNSMGTPCRIPERKWSPGLPHGTRCPGWGLRRPHRAAPSLRAGRACAVRSQDGRRPESAPHHTLRTRKGAPTRN